MPTCPTCGHRVPDAEARFCAHCDALLPSASPPAGPPPAGPPPVGPPAGTGAATGAGADTGTQPADVLAGSAPASGREPVPGWAGIPAPPPYGPGSVPPQYSPVDGSARVGPSPAVAFGRRVLAGRWEWPAVVALAPALLLTVIAGVVGSASGSLTHGWGTGWGTRSRGVLALLVLGLGGRLHFTETVSDPGFANSIASRSDGTRYSVAVAGSATSSLSLVPFAVTLLWLAVLVAGLRAMRRRQTGPEAAVRVALLGAVAATVLALIAEPVVRDVHVTTAPLLAALWTFLLCLVPALVLLPGPGRAAWLAARPQLAVAGRVLCTALLALLATVLIAGAVVLAVALAHYDQVGGWGVVGCLFLLPNLGAAGLSLGWDGPFAVDSGRLDDGGTGFHTHFGLSDLGDVFGDWAPVAAVAGGVLCALLIGLLAARRSGGRAEQLAVAGVFTASFLAVVRLGAVTVNSGLPIVALTGTHSTLGAEPSTALAAGLLWSFGGVLAGPYVLRALGGGPRPAGPHVLPASGAGAGAGAGVGAAPGAVPPRPQSLPTPRTSPQAAPQTPAQGFSPPGPPAAPPAPSEPAVHDLGVVQLDRPRKPPEHR